MNAPKDRSMKDSHGLEPKRHILFSRARNM
jgi:hypothetical protein